MGAAESGDTAGSSVSCLPRHGNERTTRNRNVRSTQNDPRWSAELDSRNRWVTARRNVIELVQRFEGLKTTDPRAIQDLKPLVMEILNFPLRTRYRVTTTDAGLLAFLRGLINKDQGLVAGSLDLLNAKKKLRHCRFDLNRVRKLARDYLYGRNRHTQE